MDDQRELCKEKSNEDIYILLYSFFIIYIFFKFFSFPHNFLSLKKKNTKSNLYSSFENYYIFYFIFKNYF